MSDAKVFLDTNVLVYPFDAKETVKGPAARARIKIEQLTSELVVSTQVLQELYVSLTKGKAPIASEDVAERAVNVAAGYTVVQVDVPLVLSAIPFSRRFQLSFWDALIIRAAAHAGCTLVLSEDLNDGQVFDDVRIENPFRAPTRTRPKT